MKPVKQEDNFGCAVACIAFVSNISYQKSLSLFKDGKDRVKGKANFYCPELVKILSSLSTKYKYEKLTKLNKNKIYKDGSIVFIEKSKKYAYGHFLCRYKTFWMDPWINLPDKNIKAGFRKRLPGKPTYVVFRG